MNVNNKKHNILILGILNILIIGSFSLYFLTDIIEYVSIECIETYTLSIIIFTFLYMQKQYNNNIKIKRKLKMILIFCYVLFAVIIIEYILQPHLKMAMQLDHFLDTGLPLNGKTFEDFQQEYQVYIQEYTPHKRRVMSDIWMIFSIFRSIFYIYFSTALTSFMYFVGKQTFFTPNLRNILFIIPIFTPFLMLLCFFIPKIY